MLMKFTVFPEGRGASIRFSSTFYRYLQRAGEPDARAPSTVASDADIEALLPTIRRTMAIANDEVIAAVRQLAPEAFTLSRDATGAIRALLATLPLNAAGAAALIEGQFDTARPDLAHLAGPGDVPAATYIWLLWAPARLVGGLALVYAMVRSREGMAGPLFSRPVTAAAERLHRAIGFTDATSLYPAAPHDLRVILPERIADDRGREERTIEIGVARSMEQVLQAFAVRSATYMAEQDCPYAEEFDGNDFAATHLIATVDGEIGGCARIRWFGDFAKVERMAVRPQFRQTRVAFRLARFAIDHCRRKGFRRIYAHSRADLLPLWKMFGLTPMPGREPFSFSQTAFREVYCDLPPDPAAIRFGADPMVTNRPEGCWDQPGPLDRTAMRRSLAEVGR